MIHPGRYAVTGGGGFVGKALCKRLKSLGMSVVALGRGAYPDLEKEGIECRKVDISTSPDQWQEAFSGVQGVFHTAAKVDMWGELRSFVLANVLGTKNVITACQKKQVSALVFTSSPSVVADGSDLLGIDESYPYPKHYEAFYPKTKAEAEMFVRAADNTSGLRTVSLRPHLIFGPGDTNLVPTILERARKGKLMKVGAGKNLTDLTYIDDCVSAHLLAMKALQQNPDVVGGKPYFISQGDPVPLWSWIDEVLAANDLAPVSRSIPFWLAKTIATFAEGLSDVILLSGIQKEPLLTKFLVTEMATSHYFDISAAERDFGYRPSRTIQELMKLGAAGMNPEEDLLKSRTPCSSDLAEANSA